MKKYRMRKFLISIITMLFSLQIFATPQVGDKLIYEGDTISVYGLDLPDEFYKLDTVSIDSFEYINSVLSVNLFGDREACWTTACGNGYQIEWKIIENQLYLIGIYSCCYYQDSIKADLELLFKEKVNNGKVKADWVTRDAFSPQNRISYDHNSGIGGYYENELEFYFKEGKLTGTHCYDNTKLNRPSIYSQDKEKLKDFIYSNINWDKLPQQDTVRVIIQFLPNEKGKIDEVKLMQENADNAIFNQEAIRVVKLIPEWEVFFFKEKRIRIKWTMPIIFSEENRKKYDK